MKGNIVVASVMIWQRFKPRNIKQCARKCVNLSVCIGFEKEIQKQHLHKKGK